MDRWWYLVDSWFIAILGHRSNAEEILVTRVTAAKREPQADGLERLLVGTPGHTTVDDALSQSSQ